MQDCSVSTYGCHIATLTPGSDNTPTFMDVIIHPCLRLHPLHRWIKTAVSPRIDAILCKTAVSPRIDAILLL